ncbi:hypothetical protein ACFQT0_13615 [Hymenobacter humi]|uniref:Nuclear transport factor 2 family protein n=1 Tax=Hymenobacter humi TaxID=1411620 RepID=A0ABW2U4G3_9BACT
MNKKFTVALSVASLLLAVATLSVQAQTKTATPARYKDEVEANPTADADIKVVSDYINMMVAGDAAKAQLLLASNYKGYGPSAADSFNTEKVMSNWKQTYATQMNRKLSFVYETFRVKSGKLKGNWVSIWGDYSFTQNGKKAGFPVQYTAHVTNGKIDADRIYYDRLFVLQTLGYKVTPPAAAAK